MTGIIFDLDQTLIDSTTAKAHRDARRWGQVYPLIPAFPKYGGIAEMLAMLIERDVPLAIVTSSPGTYCAQVIEHHKLQIAKTVCYHDTRNHKPHPDPILRGIQLLQLPAEQVWAIGDHVKDIISANKAGAHSVAVTWGAEDLEGLIAAEAENTFATVAELHQFLDALTLNT